MSKIVTLTLNPALDKSTIVDRIVASEKLRCERPIFHPGGGGVNVSRALKKLGYDSLAIYTAGGPEGSLFEELLNKEAISQQIIPISDRTRENFMVVNSTTNEQFRFGMPGPELVEAEYLRVEKIIEQLPGSVQYLIASGSLPLGVPDDFYGRLAKIAKSKNIRFICDTSGPALEHALNEGVFFVKPNVSELYELSGKNIAYGNEVNEMATELISNKKAEYVAVSLGGKGAVIVSEEASYHAIPPASQVRSTIGAGDSMVAGLIIGFSQNESIDEVIKKGVSAGTAATMNVGTGLSKKEDYEQLLSLVTVNKQKLQ